MGAERVGTGASRVVVERELRRLRWRWGGGRARARGAWLVWVREGVGVSSSSAVLSGSSVWRGEGASRRSESSLALTASESSSDVHLASPSSPAGAISSSTASSLRHGLARPGLPTAASRHPLLSLLPSSPSPRSRWRLTSCACTLPLAGLKECALAEPAHSPECPCRLGSCGRASWPDAPLVTPLVVFSASTGLDRALGGSRLLPLLLPLLFTLKPSPSPAMPSDDEPPRTPPRRVSLFDQADAAAEIVCHLSDDEIKVISSGTVAVGLLARKYAQPEAQHLAEALHFRSGLTMSPSSSRRRDPFARPDSHPVPTGSSSTSRRPRTAAKRRQLSVDLNRCAGRSIPSSSRAQS